MVRTIYVSLLFNSHYNNKVSLSVRVFQMKEERLGKLEMPVPFSISLQEPIQDRLLGILDFKLLFLQILTRVLEEGTNTYR